LFIRISPYFYYYFNVQELNWVIVKGLNVKYDRVGAMGDYPGMLIQKEAPLLVTTEVALIDPFDG